MSEFQYKAGINHVGSYQISGIPFVSGGITVPSSSATPISITFPSVTQRIWVHNGSNQYALRIGFSDNGVKNSNYYVVDANTANNTAVPQELRVRATTIYLLGDDSTHTTTGVSIFAELTGITGYDLATTYSGSVGVG